MAGEAPPRTLLSLPPSLPLRPPPPLALPAVERAFYSVAGARWEPRAAQPIRRRSPYPYKCDAALPAPVPPRMSSCAIYFLLAEAGPPLVLFFFAFLLLDFDAVWQVIPATSHFHTISHQNVTQPDSSRSLAAYH